MTSRPRSSARRRLLGRTSLALLALGLGFAPTHGARAGWPLTEAQTSVDAANPANWPNDPGYAWKPAMNGQSAQKGQWELYSFMVDDKNVRPEEKATGMSDDLAWRYTTGDPRVLVAVTDSGIEWDSDDI